MVTEMVDDAAGFLDGQVDDLRSLLEDVAALGHEAAPVPGAELARLLSGTPAVLRPVRGPLLPRAVRVRRRAAGVAAAAVSGLSVTGAAAVANELPVPMQRVVAHVSEAYLPFSFPRPVDVPTGRVPAASGSEATGDDRDAGRDTIGRAGSATGHDPRPDAFGGRAQRPGDSSGTVPSAWQGATQVSSDGPGARVDSSAPGSTPGSRTTPAGHGYAARSGQDSRETKEPKGPVRAGSTVPERGDRSGTGPRPDTGTAPAVGKGAHGFGPDSRRTDHGAATTATERSGRTARPTSPRAEPSGSTPGTGSSADGAGHGAG